MCFISLKLELISYEAIAWVLRSLCRDEMTPTMKTIQNRFKESFAIQPDYNLWNFIFHQIEGTFRKFYFVPKLTKAQKRDIKNTQSKFEFHQCDIDTSQKSKGQSMFTLVELSDHRAKNKLRTIYFNSDPRWIGVDHRHSSVEVDPKQYDSLVQFLREFFNKARNDPDMKKNNWCVSIDNAYTKSVETPASFKKV